MTWQELVLAICTHHGFTTETVLLRRTPQALQARLEIALLLRARGWSMPRIAKVLKRHHTTIMAMLDTRGNWQERSITDHDGVEIAREICQRHDQTLEQVATAKRTRAMVALRREITAVLHNRGWNAFQIGGLLHCDRATVQQMLERHGKSAVSPSEQPGR